MPHTIHQIVDALLRRPVSKVIIEGEDDPGIPMRSPEKHADSVFRSFCKAQVPQQDLPVKCPALSPERGLKRASMGIVAARKIALHMVSRNQFMLYCGPVKMRIVSPHTH